MGFPRTRGDGPWHPDWTRAAFRFSPHTRGWSGAINFQIHRVSVFPAHAGMVPPSRGTVCATRGFPRTRGDGPKAPRGRTPVARFSPHTRGWSQSYKGHGQAYIVFPAHAGMVPPLKEKPGSGSSFPRTRGDGPNPRNCPSGQYPFSPHTRGWSLFPIDRYII